eukprot:461259_1
MILSVGCCLMSENDMGHSYDIQIFLHKSLKYPNAKCLCIITTSQGTTGNIIEMGKIQKIKFAKNKKECDWSIQRFDISTKQGRINEKTGKSVETDMIVYFIPVQENTPQNNYLSPFKKRRPVYKGKQKGLSFGSSNHANRNKTRSLGTSWNDVP